MLTQCTSKVRTMERGKLYKRCGKKPRWFSAEKHLWFFVSWSSRCWPRNDRLRSCCGPGAVPCGAQATWFASSGQPRSCCGGGAQFTLFAPSGRLRSCCGAAAVPCGDAQVTLLAPQVANSEVAAEVKPASPCLPPSDRLRSC